MEPTVSEGREDYVVCSMCGESIETDIERAFAFGTENLLCPECSVARGGVYDEEGGVWDTAPDLTGLGDEAYGAAPHEKRRRR